MRRIRPKLLAAAAMAVALLAGSAAAQGTAAQGAAQGAAKAGALKWGPAPPFLPAGATFAVVEGDPGQPGAFTLRLRMPAGYRIAPHSHPTDEVVTVRRGTLNVGMGDSWQATRMHPLAVNKTETMKARENHYVRAVGRTEVEIKGTGPFEITYVKPSDDPRNKKAAKPKA
jgi:quercetin dioxygenase-like cupin family protein